MTWTSYAERQKGLPSTAIKADEATLRLHTTNKGKARLIIRIGLDVLKKGKMQIGDTVDFLVSDDKTKALIKKSERGWKLARSGKNAAEFSFPWGDSRLFDFNQKKPAKLDWQIGNGGVTFTIPKEAE